MGPKAGQLGWAVGVKCCGGRKLWCPTTFDPHPQKLWRPQLLTRKLRVKSYGPRNFRPPPRKLWCPQLLSFSAAHPFHSISRALVSCLHLYCTELLWCPGSKLRAPQLSGQKLWSPQLSTSTPKVVVPATFDPKVVVPATLTPGTTTTQCSRGGGRRRGHYRWDGWNPGQVPIQLFSISPLFGSFQSKEESEKRAYSRAPLF